jgi:hypothetical protein
MHTHATAKGRATATFESANNHALLPLGIGPAGPDVVVYLTSEIWSQHRGSRSGIEAAMAYSYRRLIAVALVLGGLFATIGPAASADLGPQPVEPLAEPAHPLSQWQFSFTSYAWLPWISGDVVVKGRTLDVAVDPAQVIDALNWPDIVPAWFSYAEARRGPLSLFNDVVWGDFSGSGGFSGTRRGSLGPGGVVRVNATFGGDISADYKLAIVEAGGAYAIWSRGSQGSPGSTAFDLLAGARYWHQEVDVSADLTATVALSGPLDLTLSGSRAIAKSGSVDWVDPFVGARFRQQLAPGQQFVLRGGEPADPDLNGTISSTDR